jgi:hypothetical protein
MCTSKSSSSSWPRYGSDSRVIGTTGRSGKADGAMPGGIGGNTGALLAPARATACPPSCAGAALRAGASAAAAAGACTTVPGLRRPPRTSSLSEGDNE